MKIFNRTVFFDKHSAEDGAAESSESVMDPLEEGLRGRPQLRTRVMSNERAASGPHGGVGDALKEIIVN